MYRKDYRVNLCQFLYGSGHGAVADLLPTIKSQIQDAPNPKL